MRQFLFGACDPGAACGQAAYAGFRIFMGLAIAFYRGIQVHVDDLRSVAEGGSKDFTVLAEIAQLGLPPTMALGWTVALIEIIGGILIALGLFTRLAAGAIAAMILVAFFAVHQANFIDAEQALLYAIPFVLITFLGAGRFGLDGIFREKYT